MCDITRPAIWFEFSIFLQYKISHFGFNHYFWFGFIHRFKPQRNTIFSFLTLSLCIIGGICKYINQRFTFFQDHNLSDCWLLRVCIGMYGKK